MATFGDEAEGSRSQPNVPPRALPNRACIECRRKKSKCDMLRPQCSLCFRIGETCVYPARRAPGRKRRLINHNGASPNVPSWSTDGISSVYLSERQNGLIHTPPPDLGMDFLHFDYNVPFADLRSHRRSFPCPSPFMDFTTAGDIDFDIPSADVGIHHADPGAAVDPPYDHGDSCPVIRKPGDQAAQPHADGSTASPATQQDSLTKEDNDDFLEPPGSPCPTYSIDISPLVASDLINEFFVHVYGFLPLLHRVKFKKKYGYLERIEAPNVVGLSLEEALLLNSIFSLSTRFSKAEAFKSQPPLHRGQPFLEEATRLFELACKQLDNGDTSFEFMQGAILLTFGSLQSGPTRQAWLLCGTCARLAYRLGLQNTDADIIAGIADPTQMSDEVWISREERRRAWWVLWDMDTFANTIAFTPYALDLSRAKVLLPMPEDSWLGGRKHNCVFLDAKSSTPWKALAKWTDQSSWSWFLAGTTLLRQAIDSLLSQNFLLEEELDGVEALAKCFALALPEKFQLDFDSAWDDDDDKFEDMNWVVHTLMMLQCSSTLVRLQKQTAQTSKTDRLKLLASGGSARFHIAPGPQNTREYHRFQKEIARIARSWSPRYLIFSSPLIVFCIVGPGFIHLLENEHAKVPPGLELETLNLVLKRLARYWTVADVLLEKLKNAGSPRDAASASTSPEPTTQDRNLWPPILYVKLWNECGG